jgi:hypothetical protein
LFFVELMIDLDHTVVAVREVDAGARVIVTTGATGQAVGRPEVIDHVGMSGFTETPSAAITASAWETHAPREWSRVR